MNRDKLKQIIRDWKDAVLGANADHILTNTLACQTIGLKKIVHTKCFASKMHFLSSAIAYKFLGQAVPSKKIYGTALHAVCINKTASPEQISGAIRTLVNIFGSSVYARDKEGNTPVHWAAFAGNLAAIQTLHSLAGDKIMVFTNKNCHTPMILSMHHPDCFRYLLSISPSFALQEIREIGSIRKTGDTNKITVGDHSNADRFKLYNFHGLLTLAHAALVFDCLEALRICVELCPDVVTKFGESLLENAVLMQHTRMIAYLEDELHITTNPCEIKIDTDIFTQCIVESVS